MWFFSKIWQKLVSTKVDNNSVEGEVQNTNAFLVNKKAEQKLIKNIKYKNLNNSPVFLGFLLIILICNTLVFFAILVRNKIGNLRELDSRWYELFFGANHTSSVFEGKQIWRIISFPFIESVDGFQVLISAIFVGLTFYTVGFYQEVFLGSKKSSIIWVVGILIIGLTQLLLTKTEIVYYHGTEYLSWLTVGSLMFLITSKSIKNEQALGMVKRILIKTIILLIIFAILKYSRMQNDLTFDNNKVMPVGSYYITFTFFSFFVGYFLTLLLNYKSIDGNLAVYGAIIFFVILLLTLFGVGIFGVTTNNIGDGSWRQIQPYY